MKQTRRQFIRAGAAAGGIVGMSGMSLAGCKDHDCNKFGSREEQPGQNIGEAKGHDKDENDPGGDAHDKDEEMPEKPGERVGHCKYD
ncbi:hypothetical protein [Haladaptatus sp. NG-SE-30]